MLFTKVRDLNTFDLNLIKLLNRISLPALRISLGIVFAWFGALKLFGESPANDVITKTIYWFDPNIFIPILGVWEVAIGVCLLALSAGADFFLLTFFTARLRGDFGSIAMAPNPLCVC